MILVDIVEGKEVYMANEEYEAMYLRFKRFFNGVMIHVEGSTMIEQLVEYMTTIDLLTTPDPHTFELVHAKYLNNLLTLYKVSNWHKSFLKVDILAEVEKIMEADNMKYIQFEVLKTKVDKRFYRLINILMAEAQDEYELEDAFFDYTDHNNILDHQSFIKYAVAYNLYNKLEYHETRSLALHEVMLEVLLELSRLFEKSLSKDYSMLKELISYASDIADTVYDEVYRN